MAECAVAETFRLSTMVNPSNSVPPQGFGANQEGPADPFLELLCSAGLDDWHAKFLSFGYESVEDLAAMDVAGMEEIGLKGGDRIRLERVLGRPVKAQVTEAEPVIPEIPQCQEPGCKQLAGSKCKECRKLLCLTHVEIVEERTSLGRTTVVKDIFLCPACKEKRTSLQPLSLILCILFTVLAIAFLAFLMSHAAPHDPAALDPWSDLDVDPWSDLKGMHLPYGRV